MSNLPAVQSFRDQVRGQLTRTEASITISAIASEKNPRVSEMDENTLLQVVTRIFAKVALRLGRKPVEDAEEEEANQRELGFDLVSKFPMLTEREIMLGLENGLDGVYKTKPEEVVYFTHSNFVQWIRAYIKQTKQPVMKKVTQLMQQAKDVEVVIPESQKLKQSHEFFLSIIKRTLDGGTYEDYGNPVYDFLDKIKFMEHPDAVEWRKMRWQALDMAKLKIIAEAREVKDPIAQRSAVQKALDFIGKEEECGISEQTISMAKRILVTQKLEAFKVMPLEEQTATLKTIADRVEYMCIELKNPEQYSQQ